MPGQSMANMAKDGRTTAGSARVHTLEWLMLGLLLISTLVPGRASAGPITVSITDRLEPATLEIAPGTTVRWRNDDGARHRVRSTSGPEEFDSGNLDPGESYSRTFDAEGTYAYVDARDEDDPAYFGTIVVTTQPDPDPGGPAPGPSTIDMIDRRYRPATVTVGVGSTVTWRNLDDRPHTVTARNGSFDSGIVGVGATFARTFGSPGSYEYWCTLHPDMVGTIVVTGDGGSDPAPPDPGPVDPEPPGPAPVGDIRVIDNAFSPASITVPVGTSVVWSNAGGLPHTVTGGPLDSGILMPRATFRHTFDSPGTYAYLCAIHPEMTGKVTVTGDGDGVPDPDPEPVDPTPPPPGDVQVVDNAFAPNTLRVARGATITWANGGALPHTVTATDGSFDSGFLMPGDTYRRTFDTPGTYAYLCTLHAGMTGSIIVGEGETGDPPDAIDADDPSSGPVAAASDVEVADNRFIPPDVTVSVGATVTWANTGELPHTVTAADGSFDSGFLLPGDTYRRTFDTPGTYPYLCEIHPEMIGTVTVAAGGTDADTAARGPAADPGSAGTTFAAGSPPPSIGVAIVFALGLVAAAVALAVGMAAFGRAAARPDEPDSA